MRDNGPEAICHLAESIGSSRDEQDVGNVDAESNEQWSMRENYTLND